MPGAGKGMGSGQGGAGRRGSCQVWGGGRGGGKGPGRMGGTALGPGGFCVCPMCGTKVEHRRATPCNKMTCPKCGSELVRE